MKLFIVRHAQSKRNIGHHSVEDSELTLDGEEQARRLGKFFKKKELDIIYCSPLKRALSTLEAIKPYVKNVPIKIKKDLVEHNLGIYGKNGKDNWKKYARDALKSNTSFHLFKPEKGESLIETYNRAKKFYNFLLKNHEKDNVLLVGHGITSMYLILNALRLDVTEGRLYNLSNASVSELTIDKKGKIKNYHINDYHHLIEEGIKIKKKTL